MRRDDETIGGRREERGRREGARGERGGGQEKGRRSTYSTLVMAHMLTTARTLFCYVSTLHATKL